MEGGEVFKKRDVVSYLEKKIEISNRKLKDFEDMLVQRDAECAASEKIINNLESQNERLMNLIAKSFSPHTENDKEELKNE